MTIWLYNVWTEPTEHTMGYRLDWIGYRLWQLPWPTSRPAQHSIQLNYPICLFGPPMFNMLLCYNQSGKGNTNSCKAHTIAKLNKSHSLCFFFGGSPHFGAGGQQRLLGVHCVGLDHQPSGVVWGICCQKKKTLSGFHKCESWCVLTLPYATCAFKWCAICQMIQVVKSSLTTDIMGDTPATPEIKKDDDDDDAGSDASHAIPESWLTY